MVNRTEREGTTPHFVKGRDYYKKGTRNCTPTARKISGEKLFFLRPSARVLRGKDLPLEKRGEGGP